MQYSKGDFDMTFAFFSKHLYHMIMVKVGNCCFSLSAFNFSHKLSKNILPYNIYLNSKFISICLYTWYDEHFHIAFYWYHGNSNKGSIINQFVVSYRNAFCKRKRCIIIQIKCVIGEQYWLSYFALIHQNHRQNRQILTLIS